MFEIVVVISTIFVWIAYHKIFSVVYFDLSRGCITEIVFSLIGGIIVAYLIMNYWFIAVPIIILAVYRMFK